MYRGTCASTHAHNYYARTRHFQEVGGVTYQSRDNADMLEKDLDNLLESIHLGDTIDELGISTEEDIKPSEIEGKKHSGGWGY